MAWGLQVYKLGLLGCSSFGFEGSGLRVLRFGASLAHGVKLTTVRLWRASSVYCILGGQHSWCKSS